MGSLLPKLRHNSIFLGILVKNIIGSFLEVIFNLFRLFREKNIYLSGVIGDIMNPIKLLTKLKYPLVIARGIGYTFEVPAC